MTAGFGIHWPMSPHALVPWHSMVGRPFFVVPMVSWHVLCCRGVSPRVSRGSRDGNSIRLSLYKKFGLHEQTSRYSSMQVQLPDLLLLRVELDLDFQGLERAELNEFLRDLCVMCFHDAACRHGSGRRHVYLVLILAQ